jgi:hypothetical protein
MTFHFQLKMPKKNHGAFQPSRQYHACGRLLWDDQGQECLDFYGGHAVPCFQTATAPIFTCSTTEQLHNIGFTQPSVQIFIQTQLVHKLPGGHYDIMRCFCAISRGQRERAEAGLLPHRKTRVVASEGAFHGRIERRGVAATDNPKIVFNAAVRHQFADYATWWLWSNSKWWRRRCYHRTHSGRRPATHLPLLFQECALTLLIADEGSTRPQRPSLRISTPASGLMSLPWHGTGFPSSGILISPNLMPYGLLGTTSAATTWPVPPPWSCFRHRS